ncbi:ATP-dependent helicase [Granulicoccus sp. GXG6511]|uniref:ATP-dependent helicase n=1 Tax=Granulicoccus sp. GXG6511 TaxID=3381351 RepID=UPI003D7DCC82
MTGFTLERPGRVARGFAGLDADQAAVAEHLVGPLLVLAGPGTGKTTALVEAVARRIERSGDGGRTRSPLVLTFSRRAAADLRVRITQRLGRPTVTPLAMTYHSFCFALLRRFGPTVEHGPGWRVLTAPEQEFRVRETLAGQDPRLQHWPDSVAGALGTRAFATEIRAVLARTRQLGLDPDDLVDVARDAGRPEWAGVGRFMAEYLDVLDFEQVLDYPELVHRCRILLTDPGIREPLRAEFDGFFLDEYQDTDVAQAQLVAELAGPGATVVAFGDPDQSIYGFRGAQTRGILDFPDLFRTASGASAPVQALGTSHRSGSRIAHATRRVAARLPLVRALPPDVREKFREPADAPSTGRGRVEVRVHESAGAEAEHIAHLLRHAHLRDGLGWGDMAVLVRSGRRNLPGLARALTAAGVPIEVAGDEIALSAELAVRPLLLALEVALQPDGPTVDEAVRLVQSPLGGLDSLGVRRLGRSLRAVERAELAGSALPELSGELIRRVLIDQEWLADCREALGHEHVELARVAALVELLNGVRARIAEGGAAEEVLWVAWAGTDWPKRLHREALRGGDGGRRADRDLDAVCALFDIASRAEELVGARGVSAFLAEVQSQQIPADTRREADLRGQGVRLMTAHRAKGLEWPLVVVASVQEGVWPDLRVRGSLLDADRLGRTGTAGGVGLTDPLPLSARLAEERRLFYVACTRARERLVVSSVEGTEGEGDQPSRFIADLGIRPQVFPGRPARPLTIPALIGELRRISVDPEASPTLRDAAAIRLARLADARDDDDRPLAPAADPAAWWGLRPTTTSDVPVLPPQEPVRISGSALGGLLSCPRQWFLGRRAAAEPGRRAAAGTGDILHVLVRHAAEEEIPATDLVDQLDLVWHRLGFEAAYLSAVERAHAESMLERYANWVAAHDHRTLLGVEVEFEVPVEVAGDRVVLTGSVDRLELTPAGLQIVDFKTGRTAPEKRSIPTHEQLGVYQLAALTGAFDDLAPGERRVAGAELVYLRLQDAGDLPFPKVFPQASLQESPHVTDDPPGIRDQHPTWVHARLADAAHIVRAEEFPAKVGPACRWCSFAASCPARSSEVVG